MRRYGNRWYMGYSLWDYRCWSRLHLFVMLGAASLIDA